MPTRRKRKLTRKPIKPATAGKKLRKKKSAVRTATVPAQRAVERVPTLAGHILPAIQLVGIGLIIAAFWHQTLTKVMASRDYHYQKIRTNLELTVATPRRMLAPVKVSVAGILEKELLAGNYQEGIWTLDDTLPLYLQSGAFPSESGHIIIYGHNRRNIFAPLQQVKAGQKITLTLASGQLREYSVTEVHMVTPDRVELLQPTDYELLTLYTCSGPFDRYRYVVQAKPVTI